MAHGMLFDWLKADVGARLVKGWFGWFHASKRKEGSLVLSPIRAHVAGPAKGLTHGFRGAMCL